MVLQLRRRLGSPVKLWLSASHKNVQAFVVRGPHEGTEVCVLEEGFGAFVENVERSDILFERVGPSVSLSVG